MALSSEALADRRRMRRRLIWWRSLAAIAIALAVFAWAGVAGLGGLANKGDYVAWLAIDGVIVSDDARRDALQAVAEDEAAKALVLRIDSPGGTFVGSDDLFKSIREVAAEKPVVAVIGDVAASGGYMAAIAADRIYARQGSITASVGVIFQSPRVTGLMDNVGVAMDVWRSGDLKARPSPLEETPPKAASQAQEMVDELFVMFLGMVEQRRELPPESVALIRDGRVVTGASALKLGLIDALGAERDARIWLEAEKQVSEDLPSRDVTPKDEFEGSGWVSTALSWVFGAKKQSDGLLMSGLLALWRPM
ncbi:MAG: signal peptide peptidase SppA [Alphaproteobacteria bacterium]|jgi:protease-4|nr:signal peptide peptidase SppA [Alphaproteobacteria bacterium]